jgi:hypothetical protein
MRCKIFGYTASPNPFRKILTPEDDYVPSRSGTLASYHISTVPPVPPVVVPSSPVNGTCNNIEKCLHGLQ